MKTGLILKRMILTGFILMTVSINAFAQNKSEREHTTDVVAESSTSLPTLNPSIPTVLTTNQAIGWFQLPPKLGYECTGAYIDDSTIVGHEFENSSRDIERISYRLIKLIAKKIGRTILRLIYTPVNTDGDGDGDGNTIIITIEIIVN